MRQLVSIELVRSCKDTSLTYFMVLSRPLPGECENNPGHFYQCTGRDWNWAHPYIGPHSDVLRQFDLIFRWILRLCKSSLLNFKYLGPTWRDYLSSLSDPFSPACCTIFLYIVFLCFYFILFSLSYIFLLILPLQCQIFFISTFSFFPCLFIFI